MLAAARMQRGPRDGRDATGEGVLRVAFPDGSEREAAVADRDWGIGK